MKNIDIHGMTNMELVRGETDEWYWATDYIHGDLYEAEELFRQGHPVRSNRLYLIHYPDGTVYEPVKPTDGQYLGAPVYDGNSVVLLVVSFIESAIRILRFLHQQGEVQEIAQLPLSVVKDCYNLMLHTSPLSLTRQPNDGTFEIISLGIYVESSFARSVSASAPVITVEVIYAVEISQKQIPKEPSSL